MTGVILDNSTFDRGDVDLSSVENSIPNWIRYDSTPHHMAAERVDGADIVITNKVRITGEVVDNCPRLKLVLLAATGTDNVDLNVCRENGIDVCNARQYSTPSVVQHTMMMMLALATNAMRYQDDIRQNCWQDSDIFCLLNHQIIELDGRQLGILGYGNLGKKVAAAGRALGMRIGICARPGGPEQDGRQNFETFLSESDVISIHCPLTDATRNLIDSRAFKLMKPGAILLNTARGAIVDSSALVNALKSGQISGAGIDVLDQEPPGWDHPLTQPEIPNLMLTPHNAWGSRESRQRLIEQMATCLDSWIRGTPMNLVN
ncbi:MAG: D-2-hydroxyacid dehydrogenase [Pseudomonadota bacterium]